MTARNKWTAEYTDAAPSPRSTSTSGHQHRSHRWRELARESPECPWKYLGGILDGAIRDTRQICSIRSGAKPGRELIAGATALSTALEKEFDRGISPR